MRFLVAILVLVLTAGAAPAADLPDLGGRRIVVASENAYPPLQFIDASGKAVGWEYDAVAAIAKLLNLEVSYRTTSWDAMIPAVAAGRFDMGMDGITIRDERRDKVDFSIPYMRSEMVMLVRADETRFTDARSFVAADTALVGAQPGTTPFYVAVYDLLDGDEANPRIKLYETFADSLEALSTGAVDMVLTDSTAGRGYVRAHPDRFRIVGDPLGTEDFGFIFPKGSDLVAPIDAAIERLKADGTFDELNETWFVKYKMGE
jgi:polar amino acid transport system substrate-binding protein